MTNSNVEQTNIFSLFDLPDEVAEKKLQEEEARKKRQEEIQKRAMEAKDKTSSTPSNSGKKREEPFEVNQETFIYHLGERISILNYFSDDELENGLYQKKEEKYSKIKGDDVRKRLEKDYPDLVAAYTDMVYIKQKNMVMAVPKAKKKRS